MKIGRILVFFISIILIILVCVSVLFILRKDNKPKYEFNLDQAAVVKEMQSLSRYETAVFTIEKIIDAGTSGNVFQELLFGDRILLIAHGQVIAGFDFSKISQNDIVVSEDNVMVTLPQAQILITNLDNSKTRVYDRRRGFLNRDGKDLESQARLAAEESIRKAACDAGILDQASENARKQLTALLKSTGFKNVSIQIPPTQCQ